MLLCMSTASVFFPVLLLEKYLLSDFSLTAHR
jgi:hypothetical protein